MSCVVPYVDAENEPPQQQQARLKAVKKRRKSVAAPSRAEPIRAAVEERSVAVESDTAALEHGTPKASAPQESAQRTPNTQREQRLRAKYEKANDVSSQRPVQALATLPAEQPPREPAELGPVLLLDDDVRAVGRRSLGKEVAQLPVQLLLIGATPPFLTRAQLLDVLQRQAVQPAIRARRDAQTASHRAQRRVVVE